MKKLLKRLLKEEEGYGTVEMILIIAGVGLLATGIFNTLNTKIVGTDGTDGTTDGAVAKLTSGIQGMLNKWQFIESN